MTDDHIRPIAVTGATGRLGGRVARRLAAAGVPQTLAVRDAARAPQLAGARVATCSFEDFDAVRRALTGCDVVLMVSASETPDRVDQHRTFVDAAAAADVGHLIYVSFFGAAADATFTLARDHWATEEHIRASGMEFTFLRDKLYADFIPYMIGDDDVIRGPSGAGKAAVVAQDDIADAAAEVMTNPEPHTGRTYDLDRSGVVDLRRDGRDRHADDRPTGPLPRRNRGGGVRIARGLRSPTVAIGRLGVDLYCDRQP